METQYSLLTGNRMSNQSLASPIDIFNTAIADAERILTIFDNLDKASQQEHEVLKRAALVMALTAWETFIECWMHALVVQKLGLLENSFAGNYIKRKFKDAINRLHNPDSNKVRHLSLEFLEYDVTTKWRFNNYDPESACKKLNMYLSLRGEAVHQARASDDPKNPHLVKREELEKAIRFFRELVKATAV